jgi:ABC-2 type transport system ATP-binding protein
MGIRKSTKLPMLEIWSDSTRLISDIAKKIKGVREVSVYGDRVHIAAENKDIFDEILKKIKEDNIGIEGHRDIIPSLEDVFISMVK